jgi:hypothetical protein
LHAREKVLHETNNSILLLGGIKNMANFKKGIALALAATTALSFAPVSTLGIPSAVVAQAAAITGTYTAKNGGITTTIVAADGVSYDLVNKNAYVENASGEVWPTSSLGWGIYNATTGKIVDIPADAGSVTADKGSLKLTVKDTTKMATALTGASIVGFKTTGAFSARTDIEDNAQDVAYVGAITFTDAKTLNADASDAAATVVEVNAAVNATAGVASGVISNDFLDGVELTAGTNNKIVKYGDTTHTNNAILPVTATNQNVTITQAAAAQGSTDNILKGISVSYAGALAKGTYYETAYVPYKVGSRSYIAKVNLTVNVGTGPQIYVADGDTVYGSTNTASKPLATDPVIYLNLTDNKTFDIVKHTVADTTGVKYEYKRDTTNVSVDANGVITANTVGDALITVKATVNGQTSTFDLQVRVAQNGADSIVAADADSKTADIFSVNDYTNNATGVLADSATGEAKLAAAQVQYLQFTVTGNETQNVKFKPTVQSKNNATMRFSFVKDQSANGLTMDPATGEITVDYDYVKNTGANVGKALGAYAVQVVSSPTAKSELTKSYFMVVIDYPDKAIKNVEDAYTVGTWADDPTANQDAIGTGVNDWAASGQSFEVLTNKDDALKNSTLYKDEDVANFAVTGLSTTAGTGAVVHHAKLGAEGKTLHVIASNPRILADKTGYTAKVTTLTAVKGVANHVETITDASTGKNIFTNSADGKAQAKEFAIDKNARLKVTLKNPVATKSSIELTVGNAGGNKVVNQNQYVTAVVDNDNTTVDLYRNAEGTQVIGFAPVGHISATDRSIVSNTTTNLAVTYRANKAEEEIAAPAQVKGVKIANVKGAKAKVSFKAVKGALGYKVVYKVGKKTVTKTLKGAAKTSVTLSVAKGKKVTVKVRAYNKSVKGKTQFGAYSAKKSLKTDKK